MISAVRTAGGIRNPSPADEYPCRGAGRRRARERRAYRWLAGAGGAGLAAVVGVAMLLHGGDPACAAGLPGAVPLAPPIGNAVHSGKATFYTLDTATDTGNCSFVSYPADSLYVALPPGEYSDAAACGGFLDVTGPRGTVRVKIVDQCPDCEPGHLDLSREAFARIADPGAGVARITYRAVVNPRLPGPLAFRIKDGASRWWFAVLVIDHGNPLRSVEVMPAGRDWRALPRADYNYWVAERGLGDGPFAIRVTDVYGHRATVPGIRMLPERVQRSGVRMYGVARRRAVKPVPRAVPSATATPVPTGTVQRPAQALPVDAVPLAVPRPSANACR